MCVCVSAVHLRATLFTYAINTNRRFPKRVLEYVLIRSIETVIIAA